MRKWHVAAALLSLATIPVLAAGCEPEPLGELVLIIKTDMAAPKDFDHLRVQVFNEGSLKFAFDGPLPGDPKEDKRIVLPSTLGLLAPDDPTNAIRIEVGVHSGGPEGNLRVVREVVTTVPPDRVAMLHVPIQFLCKKESIKFADPNDMKPSDCEEGQTCIAGTCTESVVDSTELPDYDPDSVFGGSDDPTKGKCFDVATCFEEAELVDENTFDKGKCTLGVPDGIDPAQLNLALGVESDGICNGRGCFVVLDANSETGWILDKNANRIVLPKAICESLENEGLPSGLRVLQVVQAKASKSCPQKDFSYQTCGPWSAVESAEPPPKPTSIAGAQDHPISATLLDLGDGDVRAFWTNSGDSSIKFTPLTGGGLQSVVSNEPPRDILATSKALLWTAVGEFGLGSVYAYPANPGAEQVAIPLKGDLPLPDGIAIAGNKLFWTQFSEDGNIYVATLKSDFLSFEGDPEIIATDNVYPARMAADSTYLYWTNEGAFDGGNGSVARLQHAVDGPVKTVLTLGLTLNAPRAIAVDTSGAETTLYFATIADGKVWRITNASAAEPDEPAEFAVGLDSPNGIAIDDKYVYISNRGAGTIVYKPKDAAKDDAPTQITAGQKNPGTILVFGKTLLWVNEGPSESASKEGSIVKFDASQL